MLWLYMALTHLDKMCKLYILHNKYIQKIAHIHWNSMSPFPEVEKDFSITFFLVMKRDSYMRLKVWALKDWLHKWKIEKVYRLIFYLRNFCSFNSTLRLQSISEKNFFCENWVTFMSTVLLTGPVLHFPAWIRININMRLKKRCTRWHFSNSILYY